MQVRRDSSIVPVERITASVFTVPTGGPELDGTLQWDSTTLVLVEAQAGNWRGLGYTYSHAATARLIDDKLAAVGDACELFVDANGAYSRKQALFFAAAFADMGVRWFEEPVSSDDLEGLRLLRDQGPPGLEIAATATTCSTSAGCWTLAPWTCCRPTPRAAAASPASSTPARSARRARWTSRPIRRRPCTPTQAVP